MELIACIQCQTPTDKAELFPDNLCVKCFGEQGLARMRLTAGIIEELFNA